MMPIDPYEPLPKTPASNANGHADPEPAPDSGAAEGATVIPIASKTKASKASAILSLIRSFEGLHNASGVLAVVTVTTVIRARTPAFHALVRQRLADPDAAAVTINAASDAVPLAGLPVYIAPSAAKEQEPGEEWRTQLQWRTVGHDDAGEPIRIVKSTPENVATYLLNHSEWKGVVAYDLFRECIVTRCVPPWPDEHRPVSAKPGPWRDEDDSLAVAWFSRVEGVDFGAEALAGGLSIAAGRLEFHPVREYLDSLEWDGTKRIETFLPVYMKTADTKWERRIGPAWLRSCVARAYQPGCQVDHALVLEGDQGRKKSTAFEALVPCPDWYADSGIDVTNKDSYEALRGVWLYCIGELASLAKGDVTHWKNFLTSKHDHYRPSYAKRTRDFLRQTVFCADTNKERYLNDATGNRRFWPARVLATIDVDAIRRDRDQLWAEAVATYKANVAWWLDDDGAEQLAKEQQAGRMTEEPWETIVAAWLATPTREETEQGHAYAVPHDITKGVLVADVLRHALHLKPEQMRGEPTNRVGAILGRLGWTSRRCEVDGVRAVRWSAPVVANEAT
jgi:putative DNA primase/helicase